MVCIGTRVRRGPDHSRATNLGAVKRVGENLVRPRRDDEQFVPESDNGVPVFNLRKRLNVDSLERGTIEYDHVTPEVGVRHADVVHVAFVGADADAGCQRFPEFHVDPLAALRHEVQAQQAAGRGCAATLAIETNNCG